MNSWLDRPRWTVLAILLVLVGLAGCSDEAPPPADPDDAPPAPPDPRQPVVLRDSGQTDASASTPNIYLRGISSRIEVQVEQNATLLHVELRWDDPVQDIDLVLAEPGSSFWTDRQRAGSAGAPDSPHAFTIRDPDEGHWSASAVSGDGAAGHVEWEIAATVFYNETKVPADYSGFAD